MGQAMLGIVRALQCDSCAKYVCNSCTMRSRCSDCCYLDVETTEIEIQDDSEDLEGCLADCRKIVNDER